jgi:uncharacterized protein (TIGR03083 family)
MSNRDTNHTQALLENLRREHDALAATLRPLTPAQMTTPGVHGDGGGTWTVKDILSHITWWEQSVFGWLGQPPAVERSVVPSGDLSEDEVNSAIYAGNKERPLEDVLHTFERSYTALVRALEEAGEERIAQPRPSAPDGPPIWEIVPGNTYEHYAAHHEAIRTWLTNQAGGNR